MSLSLGLAVVLVLVLSPGHDGSSLTPLVVLTEWMDGGCGKLFSCLGRAGLLCVLLLLVPSQGVTL